MMSVRLSVSHTRELRLGVQDRLLKHAVHQTIETRL